MLEPGLAGWLDVVLDPDGKTHLRQRFPDHPWPDVWAHAVQMLAEAGLGRTWHLVRTPDTDVMARVDALDSPPPQGELACAFDVRQLRWMGMVPAEVLHYFMHEGAPPPAAAGHKVLEGAARLEFWWCPAPRPVVGVVGRPGQERLVMRWSTTPADAPTGLPTLPGG